jgi:hypothetical protein
MARSPMEIVCAFPAFSFSETIPALEELVVNTHV